MKKIISLVSLFGLTACFGFFSSPSIDGRQAYFAFDSAKISSSAGDELSDVAHYMQENPGSKILIEGRCDERGSTDYNLALGALRAGNAKHFIMKSGINPARIKTVSFGKENPIYPGYGEEVWSKNRNVTIRLK